MNHKAEYIRLKCKEFFPWILAAVAIISANLASAAVWEFLKPDRVSLCHVILYIAVFMAVVIVVYWKKRSFFRPRTRMLSNETAEQRKHLILFLSNLPPKDNEGIPEGLTLSFQSLEADIKYLVGKKAENIRWSWEMPLRAIRHHLTVLESVIVVCSEKSVRQVHCFLNICKKYREFDNICFYVLVQKGKKADILSPDLPCSADKLADFQGWDFESFDELSRGILFLLKNLLKEKKYPEQDIMIDFTGGQKVTSVVAAAMTFNLDIKAQYVQTNPPCDVISYDFVHASSDTGGLGI